MSTEEPTGIPTRAIHEAYIDMQRAFKGYREAKDQQNQGQIAAYHGQLQSSALTFYELLRPHLREESSLEKYWNGKLPSYTHDYDAPDPDDGWGILQVQTKRESVSLSNLDVNTEELDHLKDWHEALDLNGNVRLTGIAGLGNDVMVQYQTYQKGLKHLDDWETKYKYKTVEKTGFMGKQEERQVERQRIPIDRLQRAVRELADAAEKLGALSDFDASQHKAEITEEQIQRLEKWRRENL